MELNKFCKICSVLTRHVVVFEPVEATDACITGFAYSTQCLRCLCVNERFIDADRAKSLLTKVTTFELENIMSSSKR